MHELVGIFEKLLTSNNLCPECIWEDQPRVIKYEISGDWKHDHLYSDYLIRNYLQEHNIPFYKTEHVTFEDGSDWYKSVHIYLILGDK